MEYSDEDLEGDPGGGRMKCKVCDNDRYEGITDREMRFVCSNCIVVSTILGCELKKEIEKVEDPNYSDILDYLFEKARK